MKRKSRASLWHVRIYVPKGRTAGMYCGLATDCGYRYVVPMETETTFVCSYCLQLNEVVVDTTGGPHQEYVEDCQVCCRPNKLVITIDEATQDAHIEAEQA